MSSGEEEVSILVAKVQELESRNASLSRQLANCRCEQNEGKHTLAVVDTEEKTNAGRKSVNRNKSTDPAWHFPKRFVALKIMYFGKRFYGFASEAQMDPTVESEIFKALVKTRLINGDKKDCQYSRCGRTDKGVSSVGQVIALYLRSNHKERGDEIDYVKLLNRNLPNDIRVMGWSPAPNDFSARFLQDIVNVLDGYPSKIHVPEVVKVGDQLISTVQVFSCLSRVYKYFFWKENLNVKAMETAGKKFIGEHDFRNFCKMDAANVHNYRRHVRHFQISCYDERIEGGELWMIKIKGTAFLWHQIRCMVAILFLIGQDLESPHVIDDLLDIERTPRKPQYKMAPELPLVLQSCEFEDLKFICSSDAAQALHGHFEKECRNYKLQAAIFHEALISFSIFKNDFIILDHRSSNKEPSHVPLMSRPTEPSYEERRAKFNLVFGC